MWHLFCYMYTVYRILFQVIDEGSLRPFSLTSTKRFPCAFHISHLCNLFAGTSVRNIEAFQVLQSVFCKVKESLEILHCKQQ